MGMTKIVTPIDVTFRENVVLVLGLVRVRVSKKVQKRADYLVSLMAKKRWNSSLFAKI
jgi:hypothetical protein